jgi:UDP-N-acetylmuramyl pentapeptide phosphotransferase/UDP-N-acetylglucosamine-1-phosphate transferase
VTQKQKAVWFWTIVSSLIAVCLGAAVMLQPKQFHPIVVFSIAEPLQIAFLQEGKATRKQCEANVGRVTESLRQNCPTCRLLENRCVEKLDPLQRKILNGLPVDAPVMRVPGGAIAFTGVAKDFAMHACKESERQSARSLSGSVVCTPAALENLALSLTKISSKTDIRANPAFGELSSMTLLAAGIAFLVCFLVIISERHHGRFSNDGTLGGPQKFHATPTPRIGGVALAAALAVSIFAMPKLASLSPLAIEGITLLALSAIPAFAGGFGEDVTKKIGVIPRLALTLAAGVAAAMLIGAVLDRIDIPGIDNMLQWPVFAIAFTAFAVGGLANAVNIIDGYNGLAGGYAILVLAALAFVSAQVGDTVVLTASLIMAGAVFGLLLWNYPKGKIFLGDGGAYLLGFWLAELSVLLVARNPEVSPWFPLALLIYPVFETIFSAYRRKLLRGGNPGHPDALHLHQLIYLRLSRIGVGSKYPRDITRRNSAVARYIWAGSALFILPSLLIWRNTPALIALAAVFCVAYMWLYIRLIRWRAPSWLIISAKTRAD